MQPWFSYCVVALLPAVCTALGAAAVFLLCRQPADHTQRALLGFAAGVMLAASVFSLLLPAVQRAEALGWPGWLPAAAGLCLGAVGLLWLEEKTARLASRSGSTGSRMILAVTLHNLPEGMVVGLALALAAQNAAGGAALTGALALSFGISLQDVPEGAAVSLPLRQMGHSRMSAFGWGVASGLVEPLGALLAFCLAGWVGHAMPWLMAAAAGAMVCVAAQEMIPAAAKEGSVGVVSVVLGFALMMALDLALG